MVVGIVILDLFIVIMTVFLIIIVIGIWNRPICGLKQIGEEFPGIYHCEEFIKVSDEWFKWSEKNEVKPYGICNLFEKEDIIEQFEYCSEQSDKDISKGEISDILRFKTWLIKNIKLKKKKN